MNIKEYMDTERPPDGDPVAHHPLLLGLCYLSISWLPWPPLGNILARFWKDLEIDFGGLLEPMHCLIYNFLEFIF